MYGNLRISKEALSFMEIVSIGGENCAYTLPEYPNIVFVSAYRKKIESFFVVDKETYQKIRETHWTSCNGYIRKSDGTEYLQTCIVPKTQDGTVIHHKGHRFVYLCSMLVELSKANHPQGETYIHGDFELNSKNIMWFREILGGKILIKR